MPVLSVKYDEATYAELKAVADSRGVSISDLAREQLAPLLRRNPGSRGGEVPQKMTAFQRQVLALLRRILAHLAAGSGEGDDSVEQLRRAKVLERGYVEHYNSEFDEIEPELSRQESNFVIDVLSMFLLLGDSYEQLSDYEKKELGGQARRRTYFLGFDANDRRESRLLGFARYLIEDTDDWEPLARYFDQDHGYGNSHMPTYALYQRMLEEFDPIYKTKLRGGVGRHLTLEELQRVLSA